MTSPPTNGITTATMGAHETRASSIMGDTSSKQNNHVTIVMGTDDDDRPLQLDEPIKRRVRFFASSNRKQSKTADDDDSFSITSADHRLRQLLSTRVVMAFIVILGAAASAAFWGIGIAAANEEQFNQFERRSMDMVTQIQGAWEDYVTAASWIHGRCRKRDFTRDDFRETYEYLINSGLSFQAAQFDPNITHEQRPAAEQEAREFYDTYYPHVKYRGLIGFNYDNSTELEPRLEAPFYFPIHYMEPVVGNEAAIDLDYHASGSRKRTVVYCMDNGQPALTDRLTLVQEKTESAFGVVLMHPGYNLTNSTADAWPRDLASIVIRIPDLIRRSTTDLTEDLAVYIYDKSDSGGVPLFLGAARLESESDISFLRELELDEVRQVAALILEDEIKAANKEWVVVVHSLENTFQPSYVFVVFGGIVIFLASIALAVFVMSNTKRVENFNKMRAASDAEKAALILDNARQATKAERELNDFIAHEVRNPVAAAMSACSFVKAAVNEKEPLNTQEQREETREDVDIIDNALRFVNDLLRNMLDMHRAANKQLKVNMTPTDLLHDVLEPVHAMLPQRDPKFEVQVECPHGLFIMTDRLRLKQICLNLARNSVKFIEEGFVRLKAEVIDDHVHIFVEDSGPGIPKEKQEKLFAKFQESLDSLSQGTGIGLFLCKNLIELMEGEISLDPNYSSGVKGNPGTRLIVNLKQSRVDPQLIEEFEPEEDFAPMGPALAEIADESMHVQQPLPDSLSVLFTDDDPILRKLFTRMIRTVAPTWNIREASNGETALRLMETEKFDLIFMDMYMASVEKQMLGTEAVKALRNAGVTCLICGLSANDKEEEFLEAGADTFTFKPFPCEARALTQELCRILYGDKRMAGSNHDGLP